MPTLSSTVGRHPARLEDAEANAGARVAYLAFLILAVPLAGGCSEAGGAIEGTWAIETPGCAEQFVFRGDGTFGNDRSGCNTRDVRITGTYVIGEDSIARTGTDAIGGEHARITGTYYLAEDRLALWALLPQGMTYGIVGTWEGSHTWEILDDADGVTNRFGGTTSIVFAADGSYVKTYTDFGGTGAGAQAGTWTEQADGTVEALFVSGDASSTAIYQQAGGAALVGGMFERQ